MKPFSTALIVTLALAAAGCDAASGEDDLLALLADGDGLGSYRGALRSQSQTPVFPFGQWSFDDCNEFRTELSDSSLGNTAYRAVAVTCAPGIGGLAVKLAANEDIVYVPDQPDFAFDFGVTVAGWFAPAATGGTRSLIRKRSNDSSSFALMLNDGRYQFIVNLGRGLAASVKSPQKAKAGVFQHVAGTYDGTTLALYVDGVAVQTKIVVGTLAPSAGPLFMGNDLSERRFNGLIDHVRFEGRALSAGEVAQLTCIEQEPTMELTPRSATTVAGVPATFDIAVTNHDSATCAPRQFGLQLLMSPVGLTLDPPPFDLFLGEPIAGGETGHLTVTATPSNDVEPGTTLELPFFVIGINGGSFFDVFRLDVEGSGACTVASSRELMIRNLSVVEDPVRTTGGGAWTFKHLMEEMAPSLDAAPAMVEEMLRSFTSDQVVNGFTLAARPGMDFVLEAWPRTADGALDLAQAPMRLLAIVNRFDLRNLDAGDAGEGRFIFGITDGASIFAATMIVEYKLPASTEDDVRAWADRFHALGSLPMGEAYNAALEEITERFVARGARPGSVNGSALAALRSNEISFGAEVSWELREFVLSPVTGHLVPATIKLTPDRSFQLTQTLADYINANQEAILAERHEVPESFGGVPFLGGAITNNNNWFAPGIDPQARHKFALNTCNGCHSPGETRTDFVHVAPRFAGEESSLSLFLTGGFTVSDPFTFELRTFNDLARRRTDLMSVVCDDQPGAKPVNLRRGISRVH